MAITQAMTTSFKVEMLNGIHAFGTSVVRAATTPDTFKIALYTSSASLDATTTAYSATNEVSGTGYTAGGNTLTTVAPTSSGTTAFLDFNDTTWSTIFQSSGNNSIYDTLQSHKTSVEGELLRVMEIPVAQDLSLTKAQADRLFSELLPRNYGHAGEIFMCYVVPNKYNVIKRLKELQAEFDVIAGLGSKERFYSACFAAAFTGAEIANNLGIIDIAVEPVMEWAKTLLKDIRKAVAKGGFSNDIYTFHKIVSKYWNEVIGQILTINKGNNPVDDALNNQSALKPDRKSTRLNSSHTDISRMPSSA